MKDLAIISLKYLEADYSQTLECLKNIEFDTFFADRDYIGNMSRAFNDCYVKNVKGKYKAIWFITNINFEKTIPQNLYDSLIINKLSAIHPAFNSDHSHIKPNGTKHILEAPFIEFTAPMFLCEHFEQFMLDENCWYYYFDLIISNNFRKGAYKMAVDHGNTIQHTYLRNQRIKPKISVLRAQLRDDIITPINDNYMIKTFGNYWRKELLEKWI